MRRANVKCKPGTIALLILMVLSLAAPFGMALEGEEPTAEIPVAETVAPISEQTQQVEYHGEISGVVWVDANRDNKQDTAEERLSGCTVYLFEADNLDTPALSTKTATDGSYVFNGLEPGSYKVGIRKGYVNSRQFALPQHRGTDNQLAQPGEGDYAYTESITLTEDAAVPGVSLALNEIAPARADATYTIDVGSATLEDDVATIPGVTYVPATVWYYANTIRFDSDSNNYHYILTGTSHYHGFEFDDGVDTSVTLQDLEIVYTPGTNLPDRSSPMLLHPGANVDITLVGVTELNNQFFNTNQGMSGYHRAGITVPETASITIGGDGELHVTGGAGSAGIGGTIVANYYHCGSVTINSGTIYATAKRGLGFTGAGIGGAATQGAKGGNITINGGTVVADSGFDVLPTASEAYASAAIGGGPGGDGGTCVITGGTVIARAGQGRGGHDSSAGIGGGEGSIFRKYKGGSSGEILISGGTVTAYAATYVSGASSNYVTGAAAIGGGGHGRVDSITITGGTVRAVGNGFAGIGSGGYGDYYGTAPAGNISITGGDIYSYGTIGHGDNTNFALNILLGGDSNITIETSYNAANQSYASFPSNAIGNAYRSSTGAKVQIESTATITAICDSDKTAIAADSYSGDGYFVNKTFNANIDPGTVQIYTDGSGMPYLTLQSENIFRSIFYTTGDASTTTNVRIYNQDNTLRGIAAHVANDTVQFVSNRTAFKTGDAVKLVPQFEVSVTYVDSGGATLGTAAGSPFVVAQNNTFTVPDTTEPGYMGVYYTVGGGITQYPMSTDYTVTAHTQITVHCGSTVLEIDFPTKMEFAAYASGGGTVVSADYAFENLSELPIAVTFDGLYYNAGELDGVNLVSATSSDGDLQLNLSRPAAVTDNGFTAGVGTITPGSRQNTSLGTLAGTFYGTTNSVGTLEIGGRWQGRFPVAAKHPKVRFTFTYNVSV